VIEAQTRRLSSRESPAGAGWHCQHLGNFRMLLPRGDRPFSWINPAPLWRSRNDTLARLFGDPTDDMRRAWVDPLPGRQDDFTIRDYADRSEISVAVLGDTGEGDGSQYAVVPGLLREDRATDFMFIVSDVIYPAGGIDDYEDKFYRPYQDYPGPVYAIPGNHDWYDSLTGFMFNFCGVLRPPPRVTGPGPAWKRLLRQLLWRHAPNGHENVIERMQQFRPSPQQRRRQPGPYLAIDAGPVLLVGIDTGIIGDIDREQGEWLRRISRMSPKPKILLTGKPLYVNGEHHPGPVEGGGTVDEIVRNPAHNYIAAIGGDIHNYQRYPVALEDGRTLLYLVSGGGGAFMHATHKIPNIDDSGLHGVTEAEFRCYPLRGDSLSIFSRNYGRLLSFGRLGNRLGFGRLLQRFWFIPPDQAAAIMSARLKLPATRPGARKARVSWRSRLVANWIAPLPGEVHGPLQPIYSELLDWNDPPMFKNFLRLDANEEQVTITCFAATGCLEQENAPPVEDRVTAARQPDGTWRWTTTAPAPTNVPEPE
jgi:Calcineurin-like phosphoesterase